MISDAFFSILLAVVLIVGVASIPVSAFCLGQIYGGKMRREIDRLIDRIDGKQG